MIDKNILENLRLTCEDVIKKYMPQTTGRNGRVAEAMNYSLEAGGKRLRPMLMFLTYKAFLGEREDDKVVEPFMAALEMIHTYSLIHDDLPAMDNDDLRRGLPTCHKKFGEDIAILAGDGLLNLAYEVACNGFMIRPGNLAVERAFKVLATRPGLNGMLGGQAADVCLTGKKLDASDIDYIYENKTAALLMCAMEIGAILAGAADPEICQISEAAYSIGMAFQVQDDIIDMTGDAEVVGKEVGQDERNDKYTYASINGIERSREYVRDLSLKAADSLDDLFKDKKNDYSAMLTEVVMSLVDREK